MAIEQIRVGDRVRWKGRRAFAIHGKGAGDIVGKVRSIKADGNLTYAVIAAEPYGQIYIPPLKALARVAAPELTATPARGGSGRRQIGSVNQ